MKLACAKGSTEIDLPIPSEFGLSTPIAEPSQCVSQP